MHLTERTGLKGQAMHRFIFIIAMSSACCTSDDNVCVASASDSEARDSEVAGPTDPGPNCCADHGKLDGYDNICAISEAPVCVGCDGQPVLCMTTGCGVPFTQDCCLVDGVTVACGS